MSHYFAVVILHACLQMHHVRSYSAILHLLNGRKSIQTQQDAKLFRLEFIYGIYKHLSKDAFQTELRILLQNGWIDYGLADKNHIQITEEGEKWLLTTGQRDILHRFHGIDYADVDTSFYERLLLLIQTLTNGSKDHMNFIPVTEDRSAMRWVRKFYHQNRGKEHDILHLIYKDMLHALSKIPDEQCALFTDRLSGFKQYGLSTGQLAQKYHITPHDTRLLITSILHHMMSDIQARRESFSILPIIVGEKHFDNHRRLSKTANQTYTMYKSGLTIAEIAQRRMLKLNTIYDHMVEITLCNPAFDIEPFVSKNLQYIINKVVKSSRTYKLSSIKEQAGEEISYFQIRLVLCKKDNN